MSVDIIRLTSYCNYVLIRVLYSELCYFPNSDSCEVADLFQNIINHCEGPYEFSGEDTGVYEKEWQTINTTASASRKRRNIPYWVVSNKEQSDTPRSRARRNTAAVNTIGSYQTMATGRKSSLRRRKVRKSTPNGAPIYYVTPEALLPDGSVISCADRWMHFTQSELRGFPIVGRLTTYSGGGYTANLGYNEETGWTVIADLHAHNWLDKQTRGVFVEFTVYNGNVNLFATAFVYLESLPTGSVFPWADFHILTGWGHDKPVV